MKYSALLCDLCMVYGTKCACGNRASTLWQSACAFYASCRKGVPWKPERKIKALNFDEETNLYVEQNDGSWVEAVVPTSIADAKTSLYTRTPHKAMENQKLAAWELKRDRDAAIRFKKRYTRSSNSRNQRRNTRKDAQQLLDSIYWIVVRPWAFWEESGRTPKKQEKVTSRANNCESALLKE